MWLLCTLKMVVKPRNCPQQTYSNVDQKEGLLKDKLEQNEEGLPQSLFSSQLCHCGHGQAGDEVGAASVVQVSESTQREGVSHLLQSQPAACSREEPPWQQPPPLCSHTVLMLYWGRQHTGPLCLHVARALKHATLLCVQMNKQNSTSSKSLSVKQNIFAEGKSPRTELGALSWASTLAFDKLIYRPKYLCLLIWIFFYEIGL